MTILDLIEKHALSACAAATIYALRTRVVGKQVGMRHRKDDPDNT